MTDAAPPRQAPGRGCNALGSLDSGPLGAATCPAMDNTIPAEQELLEHARRQTKAIEGIHSAMMLLLALAIIGALIGAAALFGS